ncbi:DUF397 domain-containing protein [Goodfellowiella coeruleoviolacea]|uniref:DUF397 domain-containing protein n=1 Tax=Goodfellowiella coeruleoviolacea TaxID=334858 RepID=A0AAE3GE81_9PSEU|nr:DUF397 domain-containing protein [Goodfellowiella coeruleoviolacea]MCP2165705.1 protein of unknown function (DUF397) [Goodfellowiella coeruleoviolacea]
MTPEHTRPVVWRKSSHSGQGGGDCVEVALTADTSRVRDSKNPDGPHLTFPTAAWHTFLTTLR